MRPRCGVSCEGHAAACPLLLVAGGHLWHPSPVAASLQLLPLSSCSIHFVCVSLGRNLPFLIFIRTPGTCNDPVSNYGHILRYWGLGIQHMNFGEHGSTHNSILPHRETSVRAHQVMGWQQDAKCRSPPVRRCSAHTHHPSHCLADG